MRDSNVAEPRRQASALHLLAIVVLQTWLVGCDGETGPEEPILRPVRTLRVAASRDELVRTLAGVARARIESRLSFRVGGTVEAVAVKLGDPVSPGQLLARLDSTDYELKVEEAEAGIAQGEAGLRQAEAELERVRALWENDNASERELQAARATAESAAAQVDAASKRLAQARQQLAYTVLRAPRHGAIASVDVEINENVRPGQVIFLLTSRGQPLVELSVPEGLIASVEEGQRANVRFDALPGRSFPGRVEEVGVAATGSANTFDATVRLEEHDAEIRSGMAAEVALRIEAGDEQILVPPVAVGEDREGRFVFVAEPAADGTASVRRRTVTARMSGAGGMIEILEGLEEGELLVTAGVRRLTDGMRVKLLADEDRG